METMLLSTTGIFLCVPPEFCPKHWFWVKGTWQGEGTRCLRVPHGTIAHRGPPEATPPNHPIRVHYDRKIEKYQALTDGHARRRKHTASVFQPHRYYTTPPPPCTLSSPGRGGQARPKPRPKTNNRHGPRMPSRQKGFTCRCFAHPPPPPAGLPFHGVYPNIVMKNPYPPPHHCSTET